MWRLNRADVQLLWNFMRITVDGAGSNPAATWERSAQAMHWDYIRLCLNSTQHDPSSIKLRNLRTLASDLQNTPHQNAKKTFPQNLKSAKNLEFSPIAKLHEFCLARGSRISNFRLSQNCWFAEKNIIHLTSSKGLQFRQLRLRRSFWYPTTFITTQTHSLRSKANFLS